LATLNSPKASYRARVLNSAQSSLPVSYKTSEQKLLDKWNKLKLEHKEEGPVKTIPYYLDTKYGKYSVLTDKDVIIEDDPYNYSVALLTKDQKNGEVFHFTDEGLSQTSKDLLTDLGTYIRDIESKSIPWQQEIGVDNHSLLFKKVNSYLASLFWEYVTGKSNVYLPKYELVQKAHTQKRKSQLLTTELDLRLFIRKLNSGEHAERMANAYTFVIRELFVKSLQSEHDEMLWRKCLIERHKRFLPTYELWRKIGIIPDTKIRKYKNLFLPLEWELIVSESSIYKIDDAIRSVTAEKLDYSNVKPKIDKLSGLRSELEKDKISSIIKEVRKSRLRIAGQLKSSYRGSQFQLRKEVSKNFRSTNVREGFNPFRICLSVGVTSITPAEGLSYLKYDKENDLFTYDFKVTDDSSNLERKILSIGVQLADYLT
jgi:hypothetical protein